MAKPVARLELDVPHMLAHAALQVAPLAEQGAEVIAKDIATSIPISEFPSLPGEPPHSPKWYHDSWKSTDAKRRGNHIIAWAFSLSHTASGYPLAEILEYGHGVIAPRPHIRPALERTRRTVDRILKGAQ